MNRHTQTYDHVPVDDYSNANGHGIGEGDGDNDGYGCGHGNLDGSGCDDICGDYYSPGQQVILAPADTDLWVVWNVEQQLDSLIGL